VKRLKLVRVNHLVHMINHMMLLTFMMYARSMHPPLVMIYYICLVLHKEMLVLLLYHVRLTFLRRTMSSKMK
jgi:hypothetical protein